jgi:hypothetical protein
MHPDLIYNLKRCTSTEQSETIVWSIAWLFDQNYQREVLLMMAELVAYVDKFMSDLAKIPPLDNLIGSTPNNELVPQGLKILLERRDVLVAYPVILDLCRLILSNMFKHKKEAFLEYQTNKDVHRSFTKKLNDINCLFGDNLLVVWLSEQQKQQDLKAPRMPQITIYAETVGPPFTREEWNTIFNIELLKVPEGE